MARIREVGKYGDSFVIKLTPIDIKDLNLKIGDQIDIEDLVILQSSKKKEKKK